MYNIFLRIQLCLLFTFYLKRGKILFYQYCAHHFSKYSVSSANIL